MDDTVAPRLLLVPSDTAQPLVIITGPQDARFPLAPRSAVVALEAAGLIGEVVVPDEIAVPATTVFVLSPAGRGMLRGA